MVRQRDPDFDIHVDPSCLSAPMDDEVPPSREDTPKAVQDDALPKPTEEEPPTVEEQKPTPEDSTTAEIQSTPTEESSVEQLLQETVDELQTQQDAAAVAPLNLTPQAEEHVHEDSLLSNEDALTEETSSPRPSSPSARRISGRTDALIQAAARAVVDQIERNRQEDIEPYGRDSVMSSAINDRSYTDGTELSYITETDQETEAHEDESRRESYISESQASVSQRRDSDTPSHAKTDQEGEDRGGDSSSHHDADSDVFSERSHSARSSLGSFEDHRSQKGDDVKSQASNHLDDDAMTQRTRSPRISDFSQYEREEFVPTIRGAPRPPFRTPSDVRALQMSSPPPSVFSGSPRSSKRHHIPTISRLGSPSPSAQYSPKGRTTPSRLKPRKVTPPLVLLHATILPLRWPWGDVLEDAASESLTPEAKTLRESWRFLHDRLGDTVCERGILLPHPQNDYEVLEERLLDALELPLRRRARILECGHYVGPANETTLTEDLDSEAEDDDFHRRSMSSSVMSPARSSVGTLGGRQTHWCSTCNHEIKFEALGPGRVFRVKVYASNGLMKAGAWEACWKEMERVDVEIEPIIYGAELQDELEKLALKQREDAERVTEEEEAALAAAELDESILEEETYVDHQLPPSSAPPVIDVPASPSADSSISRHDQAEERRVRDEARMREIYGDDTPEATDSVPVPGDTTEAAMRQSYEHSSPESPSEEARARREARRSSGKVNTTLQNATLPELLLEALRVLLQDRKNVALVLLSCLVLFLAVKPAARDDTHLREWDGTFNHQEIDVSIPKVPEVKVSVEPETVDELKSESSAVASDGGEPPVNQPCETPAKAELPEIVPEQKEDEPEQQVAPPAPSPETVTSREVVRIVETITETETIKSYVTETVVPAREEAIVEEEMSVFAEEAEEAVPESDSKQESVHPNPEASDAPKQDDGTNDAENVPLEEPIAAEREL